MPEVNEKLAKRCEKLAQLVDDCKVCPDERDEIAAILRQASTAIKDGDWT